MQGFNMGRYYPPSSLDSSLSTETPSQKPRKWQTPSKPTIRFEIPTAIWCSTCPTHANNKLIGQGVRFNAEKKRVGNYFSTPVFAFRFKHIPCGGWIEIRNDPKKAREAKEGKADMGEAWVVTEGAQKRNYGDGHGGTAAKQEDEEGVVLWAPKDPMGGLSEQKFEAREQVLADFEKRKAKKQVESVDRIEELRMESDRFGRDPDRWNANLRKRFREDKRRVEEEEAGPKRKSGELVSEKEKRVRTEDLGKAVRKSTRERVLDDVWGEGRDTKVDLGVKVRPKKDDGVSLNSTTSTDEPVKGPLRHDRNEQALVGYEDDEW